MKYPTILITGASGQLGKSFNKLSIRYNCEFVFADRLLIDFSNLQSITEFFNKNTVDLIINCAAYTAVDKAELEQELAMKINAEAVALLASIAAQRGIFMIHFSTDYVFDGKGYVPYSIDHSTYPINQYGRSKCAGELAMLSTDALDGVIIRTSWVYSEFGNNFLKTMIRLGNERKEINVINDQIGSPTYTDDLATFILANIQHFTWQGVRIYHFSNEGACSWYDFAHGIMELSNIPCTVKPIPSSQYPTPAKRPNYSLLDKSKIKEDFNWSIPHWRDSLKVCLTFLTQKN
ncbi:dTDP-4-dehydrorhamnose reductase [Mongoliitalea lutea]|uniref:dTDP-4-dehydrorhamnose reductase n=1 Tax=Mongoliitalea lutea TaxID=849756 RepID=A0A8J3D469_9BACT|nr:dTDP-4-dehydrorhamnose reductase [Mongoliitalea lutea]GHB49721.1 NAD(P)-dependent oxidoreductase [Mongoliitalea lutea]